MLEAIGAVAPEERGGVSEAADLDTHGGGRWLPQQFQVEAEIGRSDIGLVNLDCDDVDARLQEGRGAIGISVPELIKEFQRKK